MFVLCPVLPKKKWKGKCPLADLVGCIARRAGFIFEWRECPNYIICVCLWVWWRWLCLWPLSNLTLFNDTMHAEHAHTHTLSIPTWCRLAAGRKVTHIFVKVAHTWWHRRRDELGQAERVKRHKLNHTMVIVRIPFPESYGPSGAGFECVGKRITQNHRNGRIYTYNCQRFRVSSANTRTHTLTLSLLWWNH